MWFWFLADPKAGEEGSVGEGSASEPTASTQGAGADAAPPAGDPKAAASQKPGNAAAQGTDAQLDDAADEAGPRPAAKAPRHWEQDGHSESPATLWVALPWLTSLLLHVAVIVLAIVVFWSHIIIEEEAEAIIPIARLSDQPGGALDQQEQLEIQAAQDVREVDAEEVSPDDAQEELDLTAETELELVGVSGGAAGGRLAPFGTTTGADAQLGADFYGAGGNARRIAYVIDASGSMIDTIPFVLAELRRSISELSEEQEFTVVFSQRDSAIEAPPSGWKEATEDMKRQVADWVTDQQNIVPHGATNPQPALRLVMRYRPELVFLLSDNITGHGRYEINRAELLEMLRRMNQTSAAVNTIQFIYPDPLNTLEQIADDHGGVYRFITEADLGLR